MSDRPSKKEKDQRPWMHFDWRILRPVPRELAADWEEMWEIAKRQHGGTDIGAMEAITGECLSQWRAEHAENTKHIPEWKLAVLERDKWRCQASVRNALGHHGLCGNRRNLTVHHIQYRSHGGPDEEWNGITWCAQCHEDHHRHGECDREEKVIVYAPPR